mgnify:CR=1 FL=1
MARIVTVDGQKYQIGALGGIRKVDANGNPTGYGVKNPQLRKKIREKYQMSGPEPMGFMTEKPSGTVKKPNPETIPKTKSAILNNLQKAFSLDNDILQYMMKNTPGDALKQVITSNRADQKSLVTKAKQEMKVNQKGPTPKPPVPKSKAKPKGMADRKSSTAKPKDAKSPDAAYKSARDKQRRAGKLSNKSVRDTSIKGVTKPKTDTKPSRGPAYDTKAPAKQKPNARALKAIQERKSSAKNPLSKGMLSKIEKELKGGGKPVYNDGMVVGVTHKGLIGTVYTGRPQFNPFKKKKK